MSDPNETPLLRVADSESASPVLPAAVQAGALLRGYRERALYDLEALAAVVKVPVRKLEALEAGMLDVLPEPVYVRAMVVGICRVLKADPQPVLDLLPGSVVQSLRQDGGIAPVPFRPSGSGTPQGLGEITVKPPLRWAVALVLGAGLLYGWPDLESWWTQNRLDEEALAAVKPWTASGPVPQITDFPQDPAANPAALPAQPGAATEEPSNPASAGDPLSLKAHGRTWVEVLDAKGVVVLRRNLENGERVSAGGHLPLSVVVGRADVTEVWVRGKVLETKAISQENVARFEVK
jgi:cytoskeleton protein RodZ